MTLPAGWRLRIFESLPSTQGLLATLAEAGEPGRLAILARRQTAGRGRGQHVWEGPAGNLHLSVLIRPSGSARLVPQYGLLAAVALHEAAARPEVRLKWPNDLLLDEAKAAGILTEAALDAGGGTAHLVIGFGVNLAHAPELPDRRTARLGEEAPEDFAVRLLHSLDHWLTRVLLDGFAPVRAAWMAVGPEHGALLSVRQGADVLSGRYEGLAEDGGLLLATGGRVHRFLSGEVGEG
ncbi:MAG TPA: biotin--[acetyl-CoA-carboxylase] ligase [Roseococcus sp.]|nr:biotin--[acetyl-CoA-carboxylase] ligase [Roseococcus sp.]